MSNCPEASNQKKIKKYLPDESNQGVKRIHAKKSQDAKITDYFTSRNQKLSKNPEVSSLPSNKDRKYIEALEEQVREKDRQIQQLRSQRQAEVNRIDHITYEYVKFKRETRLLLAKNLLANTEKKRAERRCKDPRLGQFRDNMRKFDEGEKIKEIKRRIEEVQQYISELIIDRQKRVKDSSKLEDCLRMTSCIIVFQKELEELKKEQIKVESQVAVYKDRMKLAQKQNKSYYCRKGWPIDFDRYQVLQLLGAGGFGQVYRCYDLETNTTVALKRMFLATICDDSHKQDYFRHIRREAKIQMSLNHQNIAKLKKIVKEDQDQNLLVFQLQYCSGPELSTYLRKNICLQQSKAKLIMKQLFSAIQYLSTREERIIHYDLKPSNIMFDQGVIKILDFGLSKIMHGEDTKIQLTSQGVGTYWYLPPQTFYQYDPLICQKVDVWSLGVIFFELLYGKKPFGHGMHQSQVLNQEIIINAYQVQFPSENPRKYRISEQAKEFIRGCLTYQQKRRFSPSQAFHHSYFAK